MVKPLSPLLRGFTAAVRPPDRRKAWEWCEQHVIVDNTSPMPGRWRSDNSPWVREVMEEFQNNRVTDIAVMCSAQSSKTQTILNCACWAIAEDPGPALWCMAAKDEAEEFVRDRVSPTFHACAPVNALILEERKLEFTFATLPFYFVGAGSPSKLQSKPIRWLFLDEVRNYPPGALETVLKRTRAFWNTRRLIISTPDKKDDAVHRAYQAGDQRVFHFHCPRCHQLQPLKFEQLKAAHPDTGQACQWQEVPGAKEGDLWNFDLLAEHLRYQCVACGHLIADTPAERKSIARGGQFVRLNPRAPRHRVSFHWNALLPPWVSWRSIVEEFIHARHAARLGDIQPLKTFINETLGEPWEDQLAEIDDFDFLDLRKGDYDFDDPWPEERVRFLAADRQQAGGEHYWWLIRAFGLSGRSRLVGYGRCATKQQLEEIRQAYGVSAANCMIDSGFKASEIYRFCAATGWKAFKGDDAEYFPAKDARTKKRYRSLWSKTFVDPAFGTAQAGRVRMIPLFLWSNPMTKDLLASYMQGLIGDWTLPREIARDYLKQVTAEKRVEQTDPKGRVKHVWHQVRKDNHLWDCELMILVAAVITKIVQASTALFPGNVPKS